MTIVGTLREYRERLPNWLSTYRAGDLFDRGAFFSSRIVYYPGSGDDGQAIKLFGSAHTAHAFVYVDQWYKKSEIIRKLDPARPGHLLGYHPVGTMGMTRSSLGAQRWTAHVRRTGRSRSQYPLASLSFGLVAIVERDDGFSDDHGPRRLAIMFLKWDGFAAYDTLFCQGDVAAPYAVLLEDYGLGVNYDRFSGGRLLERIAQEADAFPRWLTVGTHGNTRAWEGYRRVPGVRGDRGGMHSELRYLYQRERTGGRRVR